MLGVSESNCSSAKIYGCAHLRIVLLVCICFLRIEITNSQTFETIKLAPVANFLENNSIAFELSAAKLKQLHVVKGEKLSFKVPYMIVNDDSIQVDRVRIRGNTSSYLRRKSLNIKLNKKALFYSSTDTFSLKKFFAVSLSMDKNYIRNRFSYEVLQMFDVQTPFNCYSNVMINGRTEGLYMIFYPPEDFALKEKGASLVIRRGYNASVDKFYYEGVSRQEANTIKKKFVNIYEIILNKYTGEELYHQLNSVMDMRSYFYWLAFNHLFQNGDYADEVYFMWNSGEGKFKIMPWDFDDILRTEPHEGLAKRNELLHGKLIFSGEDLLDVSIANDSYLYNEYLIIYQEMLEELTPDVFGEILQRVYQQVYPYFMIPDVVAQSQYDQYGLTNLESLEGDLQSIHQTIGLRMITLNKQINAQLRK